RSVRHPIYTGLLLALLGSAMVLGEVRGFLGLALVALAFRRKIGIEERFLLERFGAAYERYRAEVPALLPIRWRLRTAAAPAKRATFAARTSKMLYRNDNACVIDYTHS